MLNYSNKIKEPIDCLLKQAFEDQNLNYQKGISIGGCWKNHKMAFNCLCSIIINFRIITTINTKKVEDIIHSNIVVIMDKFIINIGDFASY